MSNPGILYRIADNNRKLFIQNCIQFDAPRLEAAVYPEGLTVESDLPYAEGTPLPSPIGPDSAAEGNPLCCSDRTLDIYTPSYEVRLQGSHETQ